MEVEANAQAARAHATSINSAEPAVPAGVLEDALCERVIAELFGCQFARGAQTPRAPAIFEQLRQHLAASDLADDDWHALSPSPGVDACLQRLVAIIQGDFEACDRDGARTLRSAQQHDVQTRVLKRIHGEHALQERARQLRGTAALAETALEHHHSPRLLERLRAEVPGEVVPFGQARACLLKACLFDFPYTHNYAQLLAAELRLLQQPAPALLLRDRELLALAPTQRRVFEAGLDRLRAHTEPLPQRPLSEYTIAICGCGPLPISGLMLHAWTGARVLLIDRDAHSIAAADAWVHELERLHVLDRHAVQVCRADIGELAASELAQCDVVLVASLVAQPAKARLAARLRNATRIATHTLLLRSGVGLCGELAYEPVDTAAICHLRLPFCGESLPHGQVLSGLDASAAARRGVCTDSSRELLTIADREVLNSTELYRRVPLSDAQLRELAPLERLVVSARQPLATVPEAP